MKRICMLFTIFLFLSFQLQAFDGFTDIFDTTEAIEPATSATAVAQDPLDIGGSVSFNLMGIRNTADSTETDTSVNGGLTLDLSWKGSIVDAKASLALEPEIDNVPTWIDLFTGLSITTYFEGGRLEAGLLKKEWGSGDGVHVVDVLNAPDYRKGIVDDPLAMKIAEPMIMTTATWGQSSVEVVYKPMLIPMVAEQDASERWSMLSASQAALMSSATVVQPTPKDLATLSHSQYGARVTGTFGAADLGLIYWRGYYNQPALDITLESAPPYSPETITLSFTRAHLFGTEGTFVLGPFTFMFEGGFWLSEDHDGTDPAAYNNKWVYLGGVGFMVPKTNAYVSFTYNGHYIMDFAASNPLDTDTMQADQSSAGKAYMNTITGALEVPFAREQVKLRLAGTYQVETKGYVVLPSVTWSIRDDLVFQASGRIFDTIGSGSDSLFNTWKDNDSLTLGIRYLF